MLLSLQIHNEFPQRLLLLGRGSVEERLMHELCCQAVGIILFNTVGLCFLVYRTRLQIKSVGIYKGLRMCLAQVKHYIM